MSIVAATGRAPAPASSRRGRRSRCGCGRAPWTSSSARSTCSARARRCGTAIEAGEPHSAILYGPPGRGRRRWRGSSPRPRAGRLRGGVGGERGPRRGAGGDRARRGAPPRRGPADDLLPRRDPPVQQGPAGRAAAGGRGGPGDADRGDDREPLLRGQLGAALARADLRARRPLGRAGDRGLLRRALADPERGIADPPEVADEALELLATRSGGDARVRSARSSGRWRPRARRARDRPRRPPRTRCSARRSPSTARAISTTTTSRPGSRRRGAPTRTPRSTTWR